LIDAGLEHEIVSVGQFLIEVVGLHRFSPSSFTPHR